MHDRRRRPYVGITGFTRRSQVEECLTVFNQPRRLLMVGVLASSKTLNGGEHRFAERYPPRQALGTIFVDDPRVLNLIHFNTKHPENLVEELTQIMSLAGPHCHGVQLNIAWPDPKSVTEFRRRFPEAVIVLQCGSRALGEVSHAPSQFVRRLCRDHGRVRRPYDPANWRVDHVLIDPSGGLGKLIGGSVFTPYLERLVSHGCIVSRDSGKPAIGPVVAGGLCAKDLDHLIPLLREYPDLSYDAEGRLRDEWDRLDLGACREYLRRSIELVSRFA